MDCWYKSRYPSLIFVEPSQIYERRSLSAEQVFECTTTFVLKNRIIFFELKKSIVALKYDRKICPGKVINLTVFSILSTSFSVLYRHMSMVAAAIFFAFIVFLGFFIKISTFYY